MTFFLLLAGLYAFKFESGAPIINQPNEKSLLTGLDIKQITQISLRSAKANWTLVHNNEKNTSPWTLQEFNPQDTDSQSTQEFVNSILQLHGEIFTSTETDSAFGLTQPEFTLTVEDASKKLIAVFGKVNSLSRRRYVSIKNNREIFLVEDKDLSFLKQNIEKLLDYYPFREIKVQQINQIEVKNFSSEGKFLTGYRVESNLTNWKLLKIEQLTHDKYSVTDPQSINLIKLDKFITAISSFKVLSYLGSDVELKSIKTELKMEILFNNSKAPIELLIGEKISGTDPAEQAPRVAIFRKNNQKPVKIILSSVDFNLINKIPTF